MPDVKSRKFFWLKPGTLNTFTVKAISGVNASEESEIEIRTSGFSGMTWASWKRCLAKPVYWNRTILVNWNPIAEPLRMDYYRLFRKSGSQATAEEIADNSTDNPYWIRDTGRVTFHIDHALGKSPDIVMETAYYYWVWAFDKKGDPSAHHLGNAGPGTAPDYAELGKPDIPKIQNITYEHQKIIKWLADATVRFEGEAEGYWLQRRMKGLTLWGPLVWVDHEEDKALQEGTLGNYISGATYQWRVKAVNVPFFLVSDWSDTYEEKIPYDSTPPEEVEGCNARRLKVFGLKKGEHIRVQWRRPALALLRQQIERYQVFRYIGTEAGAIAYEAQIEVDDVECYDDMSQLQGTRFVDDDVQPFATSAVVGFHFDGDHANGSTVAYHSLGTTTGTLNGTASMITSPVNDGTYALDIAANGDYISFSNPGQFDSSEGYLEFYIWHDTQVLGMRLFRAYYDANNYMELFYNVGRLYFNFVENGNTHTTFDTWLGGATDQWAKIQARWDVANNTFGVQFGGLGWSDNSGDTLNAFADEPGTFEIGSPANNVPTDYHFDSFHVFTTYDPPEDLGVGGGTKQYYHYWVRSIDVAGLKGPVSMKSGMSYDRVSFEPPPAPTGMDIIQNAIDRWIWTRFTMLIRWDAIPEAVYYRVKLRVKGAGKSTYGPWLTSPFLDESRITEIDEDDELGVPKYVVPFTVSKDSTVEYKVSAGNAAGETWADATSEIINSDDVGPSPITDLAGECYGFNLFGIKIWLNVWLNWSDHPWYEGVNNYEVFYYYAGEWRTKGHVKPTWINGKKTYFWVPVLPGSGGAYKFKVVTTDGDDNTSESNIVEIPWQAFWDWRDRGV